MPNYRTEVTFNYPDYAEFIVDADDNDDAEYKALELMKERFPEAVMINVDTIEEIA